MRAFEDAPFLVIWEVTQACSLACVHCRACAQPRRNSLELTTTEGFRLIDEIRSLGEPLVVFTGGDPLERPDLTALLTHSVQSGLRTTVTPSATPLLTADAIQGFLDCGVARMALSLDGPDAASHDSFRKVEGSFDRTILALGHARRIGLAAQINTTVSRHNLSRLTEIADRVEQTGACLWSVFFLVPTGRAQVADDLSPDAYEKVFEFLFDRSRRGSFDIKTTEAQHYRRFVAQRIKADRTSAAAAAHLSGASGIQRQAGINDGKGFVFVSHTGEIYPSGFLPISAGNVRSDSLVSVYRSSPLFLNLRDSSLLKGKCGRCEYRNLCGGSRSRAYALSGDPLGEDPNCVYNPPPAREQGLPPAPGERLRPAAHQGAA